MELFKRREASRSLQSWVEASSLLAAVLYAFGWIFTARLFARFSVTPEEVGFSFAFLLIRVVFLVLAFVAIVVLIVWVLNRVAAAFSDSKRTTFPAEFLTRVLVTGAGVVILAVIGVSGGVGRWIGLIFIAARAALGAILVEHFGISFSYKAMFRFLSYGVAVLGIAALIAAPFWAANQYADQIEDGKELRAPILPGIAGLSIQRVQATTSDDEPISPKLGGSACVHLLGSSGGTLVLYDYESDSVVRVPQGRVSLEDPCN
jgi:hypothetical protein